MSNDFAKNITLKLKCLAIYQIAGGIIGLALTVWMIAKLTAITGLVLLFILIAIGLYSFSIYCGTLLLKNKKAGFGYSLINQFLQLICISVGGFTFQYLSGVFFVLQLDWTNSFNFNFNLGISAWQIAVNQDPLALVVNFNLVALFLIIFIDKIRKQIKEHDYAGLS